jgi:hypothetical protein
MRLWQRPQRFVSLAAEKSKVWLNAVMSMLLVSASILPGAFDSANAVSPPGNLSIGPCNATWQGVPANGFTIADYSMVDSSGGGHGDAYDNFGAISIGGTNDYGSGTLVNSANDWVSPYITSAPQNINGLTVSVQSKFMSGYTAMRQIISVTNPSASATSTNIQVYGNLGSDGSETQTTSDGDSLYETTDNWIISRDSVQSDPVLSWAFSDATAPTRISTFGKYGGDNEFFVWNLSIKIADDRGLQYRSANKQHGTGKRRNPS